MTLKAKSSQGSWYATIFENGQAIEELPTVLSCWQGKGMHFHDRGKAGDSNRKRAQEYAERLQSAGRVVLVRAEMNGSGVIERGRAHAIFHVENVRFDPEGLHMDLGPPRTNLD
jgi:hypothetical protein